MTKYSPILLFLVIYLSGCSVYQYATLDGTIPKDGDNQLVLENDTLKLMYSFNGYDCQASVQIFNKLDVPLYLDWKRSAYIVTDKAIPSWDEKTFINATTFGTQVNWNRSISTSSTDINGTLSKVTEQSFIPPASYIESPFTILNSGFFKIPLENMQKGNMVVRGSVYTYKVKHFSRQTTPFNFRSYLTFSLDPDFKNPFVVDNVFWVSEVLQSAISPTTLEEVGPDRTDRFYSRESSGAGIFIGALGIATITYIAAKDE